MNDYFKDTFSKVAGALENKTMYHNENIPVDIGNYPKHLYKYKSGFENHDFAMIEEEYLWANFANGFDDPTDSFVNLSVDIGDRDSLINLLLDNYEKLISYSIKLGKTKEERFSSVTKEDVQLYKGAIMNARGKFSMAQSYEFMQKYTNGQFKDALIVLHSTEFRKIFDEYLSRMLESMIQILRKNCTICSLTSRKDNQKLWEDFADKYSGFVIEYDTRKCVGNINAEAVLSNIFEVSYRKRFPKVSLYSIFEWWFLSTVCGQEYDATKLTEDIYSQLFLKKKEYAGEEEWRLIAKQNRIPFPVVSAVYMGYKITPENEDRLKRIWTRS